MSDTTLSSVNNSPPNNYFASLDGLILTVLASALGNADTSYTYIPLVMSGFNGGSLQWVITATTLTFEFSNSALSVADASATWSDQTTNLTGAATVTATGSLTITVPFGWSRMRVKRVTTNATNALQLILTRARIM